MNPRNEYPRPQLVRDSYLNLNGEWQFEIDHGASGRARGLSEPEAKLSGKIILPFCPESRLSGVEYRDFMASVWYRREVGLTKTPGKRILFHVDACDYRSEVWVNGVSVGHHFGGSSPAVYDITSAAKDGINVITICAEDDTRSGNQPVGKQSVAYASHGCSYTRTTGIWQTVWIEEVPEVYITNLKLDPDVNSASVHVDITFAGNYDGEFSVEASYEGKKVGAAVGRASGRSAKVTVPLSEKHLWEVGEGRLYDLDIKLGEDSVRSYFGLREVYYDGRKMILNGKPVFQRLVLDQGFYPDGIWTAPTDDELKADIERSMACGFNGARLHQKVFEPRFLYHADKLGYIVWGEHGNWGLNISRPTCYAGFIPEWVGIVKRDYNHPSIVGWCPLNETQKDQDRRFVETLYDITKTLDPNRMFVDCSGWCHVRTEVWDMHNYDQNPEHFKATYEPLTEGKPLEKPDWVGQTIPAEMTFVSEYGGIGWNIGEGGWGYGNGPKTEEEFIARYKGLTDVLLDNPAISAFCYTQLTDVEQERNGLYTYDRNPKFDPAIFKKINSRKAAIEK